MQVCMRIYIYQLLPGASRRMMQHGNEQIDRFIKTLRKKDFNYEYMCDA